MLLRELVTCCLKVNTLRDAYLIEREHLAGHGTPVIEGDAHAPVDLYGNC